MQMLQSDWLSDRTLSAISVQWLEDVYETATFFLFAKFWRNLWMQIDNWIPEKTKRRTLTVSRLWKLEIIEKMMRMHITSIWNENSIRAIFLRREV